MNSALMKKTPSDIPDIPENPDGSEIRFLDSPTPPPIPELPGETHSDKAGSNPVSSDFVDDEIQLSEVRDVPLSEMLTPSPTPAGAMERQLHETKKRTDAHRSLPFRVVAAVGQFVHWTIGLFGLIFCLAIAAVIPLFQFMALGYFFEVTARIRNQGRVRAGFVGLDQAARLSSIIIGTWLLLWPITLLGTWWEASYLIDPLSETTRNLRTLQIVGTVLILAHILAAWFCGGHLRYFFWPVVAPFAFAIWLLRRTANSKIVRPVLDGTLGRVSPALVEDLCRAKPVTDWFLPAILWKSFRSGKLFSRARDGVWNFVLEMKLPYLFSVGLRGFVGTMLWLAIPVTIMIVSAKTVDGAAVLTGLAGIISFGLVATWLPILQAHFASENRFAAMFELRVARETFRRVPIRYLTMLLATFVFALPLFLLKVEKIFPELLFLPAIVFILFMLPTRFIAGWTYLKACQAEQRARLLVRWPTWLVQLALAFTFAGFVFLMRFVIWTGAAGLFDQHAFLIPAPFTEWPF